MDFINKIKDLARQNIKTIVLPESEDLRVLKGAEIVLKEGFANIILLGDKDTILNKARENNIDLNNG